MDGFWWWAGHGGPVWAKMPRLIFGPSPALSHRLWLFPSIIPKLQSLPKDSPSSCYSNVQCHRCQTTNNVNQSKYPSLQNQKSRGLESHLIQLLLPGLSQNKSPGVRDNSVCFSLDKSVSIRSSSTPNSIYPLCQLSGAFLSRNPVLLLQFLSQVLIIPQNQKQI